MLQSKTWTNYVSFNKTIREARKKPLLDMLEDIRRQCMVSNAKVAWLLFLVGWRQSLLRKDILRLNWQRKKEKDCRRYMAYGNWHEIDHHSVSYSVYMDLRTCGCMKWQLTGILCIHTACVIVAKKIRFDDYVVDYYTTERWRQAYSRGIKTCPRDEVLA